MKPVVWWSGLSAVVIGAALFYKASGAMGEVLLGLAFLITALLILKIFRGAP